MIAINITHLNKKYSNDAYLKIAGLKIKVQNTDTIVDEETVEANKSLFTSSMDEKEWTPLTSYYIEPTDKKEEVKINGSKKQTNKDGKSASKGQSSVEQNPGDGA